MREDSFERFFDLLRTLTSFVVDLLLDMLPNPAKQLATHVGCLIAESFLDVVDDVLDGEAVGEVIEGVEGLLHHLGLLLSELADDGEEVDLRGTCKVFAQTSGHHSCDFQGPEDDVEVAVVDESANQF